MKPKNEQRVVVAYPHPAELSSKFHISMLRMLMFDAYGDRGPDGKRYGGRARIGAGGHFSVLSGAQITKTRNKIVRQFLEHPGEPDWLLMIDADMEFAPDLAEALVAAAHPELRPIVGGLCFAYMRDHDRKYWPTLYSWIPGTERLRRLTQYPADMLMPVAATGAACLLVHRSVFVEMAKRFPPPWPWFAETPFYEKDEEGNPILDTGDAYSEDITFCLRAQAAGFPIYVHTGIKIGHVKELVVDEGGFIEESERLRQACVPVMPTYAVVASKSRPEMLATLRAQLAGQVDDVFVFDNGYDVAPEGSIEAHGWPLHKMWNTGLEMAKDAAGGGLHNVLIINDDVEVPNEFCAQLEGGLRAHDDHWISYPNWRNLDIPVGEVVRTQGQELAGQTMSGWAFMLRGEVGLRFDERFSWWYGDTQLERQVRDKGMFTVCVGGCFARHLDPLRSTLEDSERLAQAEADEVLFAELHGIDAAQLWLAQRRANADRRLSA